MAELADALASGASDRKVVQVQVLFPAPSRTVSNVYHARTMQFFDFHGNLTRINDLEQVNTPTHQ